MVHRFLFLHCSWLHLLKHSCFPVRNDLFLLPKSFFSLLPAHRKAGTQRPLFLWIISDLPLCLWGKFSLKPCGFPKNPIEAPPLKLTSTFFFKTDLYFGPNVTLPWDHTFRCLRAPFALLKRSVRHHVKCYQGIYTEAIFFSYKKVFFQLRRLKVNSSIFQSRTFWLFPIFSA